MPTKRLQTKQNKKYITITVIITGVIYPYMLY